MNNRDSIQLWVLKFCLKVVYPKFNTYAFIVYLAIRYRYLYYKKLSGKKIMSKYSIKTLSDNEIDYLIENKISDQTMSMLSQKCLIVSYDTFCELCVENFFYKDNGVVWVLLKLTPEIRNIRDQLVDKGKGDKKFNLSLVTSEIYKKLWPDSSENSMKNERIVPVLGSKRAPENTIYTNEIEFANITSSFGIFNIENAEFTFHPIPNIELSPKIAETAEVHLIVNEYDLPNDFLKEVLSNYFETPKLVSVNDVIFVNLTPSIVAKYHYKYLDLVEVTGRLYFRCKKLSASTNIADNQNSAFTAYYIVKGVTHLTLGEVQHAIKPKNEFHRPSKSNSKYITRNQVQGVHICPTGLKKKFEQIQEIINPFLTGEIENLSSSLQTPLVPILLLTGSIGSGRHMLVKVTAKYNGLNCLNIDCNALQSSTAKQTESKISAMFQKAKAAAPVIVLLDNFEVFGIDPENNEDQRIMEYFMNSITDLYQNYTKHPIIFIAVTDKIDLKPNIMRIFLEKINIPKLKAEERFEILQWYETILGLNINKISNLDSEDITNELISKDILQRVASKTETFLYGDLDTLMHFAMKESYMNQSSYIHIPKDPNMRLIHEEDFNNALEAIRGLQSQHLDAPKIPKVQWEDIGGLDKLKKELLKTIEFPIKFPHLFKNSTLKRSGILLYGPPGCGKTLVAKAVSTELNVSFMSVKGPELLNMYIGQSEENVRNVFTAARASSPCIVFLDELDALCPRRGAAGDSGGASDRVVSQLLAELDGVTAPEDADSSSFVFIMGATNRPDLLEQSLLRPGRLDKLVYVAPYSGPREKLSVLRALCRSYKLRPEVNLSEVAAALPARVTGADVLQVVSTARAAAVRALITDLHNGVVKESALSADSVVIGPQEMWQGVEAFRPSITDEELDYYESLQSQL